MKQNTVQGPNRNRLSQDRRNKLLKKLKFYSTAASLGAFACSSTAQGNIVVYDVNPDAVITNVPAQKLDLEIHADGPSNPDSSVAEFSIRALLNQIRVDTVVVPGTDYPERTTGNAVLSAFGTPYGTNPDPNPGYYTQSFPAGTPISSATLAPSFYVGLALRFGPYGSPYNFVGTGQYVGLLWDFDGAATPAVRYGWAEIDASGDLGGGDFGTAVLKRYAFEMTPDTPILAGAVPEPSSLALLAAGGGGLALAKRRRRRS